MGFCAVPERCNCFPLAKAQVSIPTGPGGCTSFFDSDGRAEGARILR